MPTTLGLSKGHEITLRILENLVKTDEFFQGDKWVITNEFKNPNKHNFKDYMKFDIALWKNDYLYGIIEFDGKQHHERVIFFHGDGDEGIKIFLANHLKDKIKNMDALKLSGKKCLRIGPEYGAGKSQQYIKTQILAWLSLK